MSFLDTYCTSAAPNTNTAGSITIASLTEAMKKLEPFLRRAEYEQAKCTLQGVMRPTLKMHPEDVERLKGLAPRTSSPTPFMPIDGIAIELDPTLTPGFVKTAGIISERERRMLNEYERRLNFKLM